MKRPTSPATPPNCPSAAAASVVPGSMLPARIAYRLWADSYDVENPVTVLDQRAVRELTPPLAGKWLLDAASGTGRRLPRTGGRGPRHVLGIDLVFEMLRRRRTTAALAVADMRMLPCRNASFDVVWCRLAVGHVPDLERVYLELARVARTGAHIIITDFHPDAARAGHLRTFRDARGQLHGLEHHIHDDDAHLVAAARAGLVRTAKLEPAVGRVVRRFYVAAGRLEEYERQRGLRLVLAQAFRA